MAFRFLHLADLHLETSFGGRPETRERLRAATREAFEHAVDYAIENRLHAVLAAGDLYDDRDLCLSTESWFAGQVERLARSGCWFVAVCGNHDPGGPNLKSARLRIDAQEFEGEPWRKRVHVFRKREPETVVVTDGDGDDIGIVVGAGHPTDHESENLAAAFPRIDSPLPVVGLLHTNIASANAVGEHKAYAPSNTADYRRLDYSYWALGHIHVRQQAVPDLPVYYAGNLQGRNPKESGEKGGYVVEAHPQTPANPVFVPFAPVRWERIEIDDLRELASADALVEHLRRRIDAARSSENEELAVRLVLSGITPLAPALRSRDELEQLERDITQLSGAVEVQLRVERVSRPIDRETLRESPTVVGTALKLMEDARTDADLLDALAPANLASGPDGREERRAYLLELLSALPDELIERAVAPDDA